MLRNVTPYLLMLLIVSTPGCVAVPTEPNPWSDRERVSTEAVYPIEYPELASDLSNIESVLEAALGNYDIAEANAKALEEMSRAYNSSLDAGEAEFELGQIRARQLAEERRARLWDKLSTWSIVAFLGLLSVAR